MYYFLMRQLRLCIIAILFGIFDYYTADLITFTFHIPLFFDTIFCCAIGMYANPLYSILSITTTIILTYWGMSPFPYVLYSLIAVIICIITSFFYKRYLNKPQNGLNILAKLLVLSFIIIIVSSVGGGVVNILINNITQGISNSNQTDFLGLLLDENFRNSLFGEIFVRIPINIVDRILTIPFSWGVCKLLEYGNKKLFQKK